MPATQRYYKIIRLMILIILWPKIANDCRVTTFSGTRNGTRPELRPLSSESSSLSERSIFNEVQF